MGGTKIPRATKNTNKKSTSFHSFIQDDEHSKLKHQWQVAAAGQKLVVDLASGLNEIAARRQWRPLQYSCLENPMDGGAWWATVHEVAEGRTRLSDFTFTFHLHALQEEMATHSSVLAWRIPGTAGPGGLLSMGSHRVGDD